MKIEQLLVQHFYNNKEVTLQGMGTFTLSPDFVMPKENDKDAEIPENAISFQYDAKAVADESLIDYIVQQTRKMKSLAAADLDSYLVLGKQFLNIGKPFKIDGMGMLVKNQQGQLEFTKGQAFHTKMETTPALKEQRANPEISFASESKKREVTSKKGLLIAGVIVALALIIATAWYFVSKKESSTTNENIAANADTGTTTKSNTQKADTVAVKPIAPPATNDGYTFKVVFLKTMDSAAAVTRMNKLTARNHKVIMYQKDSLLYYLAEPFTLPLADTAYIKDSLNRFYYLGKAVVELQ